MTIPVTKTYLPPLEEYVRYLQRIWASGWITNNGELVQELEAKLAEYLGVPYVQYVANGTIALQLALRALEIQGEVITTPFSYVATTNAILWEGCQPVFVDIEPRTFCVDADKIEAAITEHTRAILAVHVYGIPCAVEKIQAVARKHNLPVVYDAAHAFGCRVGAVSVASFGDLSTLSFHATKLFHTAEGGAIVAHTPAMAEKLWLLKSFGHKSDDYFTVGINGKNSELHAAMGLCLLPRVDELVSRREACSTLYDLHLNGLGLQVLGRIEDLRYNYAYYPVVFQSNQQLVRVKNSLNDAGIYPRRYFYPALNRLPFLSGRDCPVAEGISQRVLCLPLYHELEEPQIQAICSIIASLC